VSVVASRLYLEARTDELVAALRAQGYSVVGDPPFSYYFGSVQAMEIDYEAGELHGAADPRRAAAWDVDAPG
jgi:gamma-glutamyltranspeptidase/glutathione hydrolase